MQNVWVKCAGPQNVGLVLWSTFDATMSSSSDFTFLHCSTQRFSVVNTNLTPFKFFFLFNMKFYCILVCHSCLCTCHSYCTWCGNRVPSEGDIEGWLVSQRRRIHPSANEEACTTAEQHPHHQQHPEKKTKHITVNTGVLAKISMMTICGNTDMTLLPKSVIKHESYICCF